MKEDEAKELDRLADLDLADALPDELRERLQELREAYAATLAGIVWLN